VGKLYCVWIRLHLNTHICTHIHVHTKVLADLMQEYIYLALVVKGIYGKARSRFRNMIDQSFRYNLDTWGFFTAGTKVQTILVYKSRNPN